MKNKIFYVIKFMVVVCCINLLVGCSGADGQDITVWQWLFAPTEVGGQGNAASFLTIAGKLLGGPWGYALTGLGASVGPMYKWVHHDKSATGLIKVAQLGRAALPEEARKVYDDTVRDAMDHAQKGDLRSYVRDKKVKLRYAGKMVSERFSDKHKTIRTVAEVLASEVKRKV